MLGRGRGSQIGPQHRAAVGKCGLGRLGRRERGIVLCAAPRLEARRIERHPHTATLDAVQARDVGGARREDHAGASVNLGRRRAVDAQRAPLRALLVDAGTPATAQAAGHNRHDGVGRHSRCRSHLHAHQAAEGNYIVRGALVRHGR